MFIDLVGSTALSTRLDPEEMREVMRAYQSTAASELVHFDGHVAKFMGDGIVAYFGWPRAHEDEAERAVRAALRILDAVGRIVTPSREALAARIGIATGVVVVGDLIGEGAAQEEAVIGDTPNLAARLQSLADPNEVIISEGTRRLLGGLFEFEDLGGQSLKGLAAPVKVFRVLGPGQAESRFEAFHGRRPEPLVGRAAELSLLLDRWQRATAGEGQVVFLSGEPGIGKSRLVLALRERLANEPFTPLSLLREQRPLSRDRAARKGGRIRPQRHAGREAGQGPSLPRLIQSGCRGSHGSRCRNALATSRWAAGSDA